MKVYVVRGVTVDDSFIIAAFHANLAAAKRCADDFAEDSLATEVVEVHAAHDYFAESLPPEETIVYEGRF